MLLYCTVSWEDSSQWCFILRFHNKTRVSLNIPHGRLPLQKGSPCLSQLFLVFRLSQRLLTSNFWPLAQGEMYQGPWLSFSSFLFFFFLLIPFVHSNYTFWIFDDSWMLSILLHCLHWNTQASYYCFTIEF